MMNTSLLGSIITIGFSLAYLGIIAWTLWPKNKKTFQAHGLIPLKDEDTDNEY